jgi:hypothetical protein
MAGYLWTCWSILASAVATAVLYTAVYRLSWLYALVSLPILVSLLRRLQNPF